MVEAMNVLTESLWEDYMVLLGWISLNSSVEIRSRSQSQNSKQHHGNFLWNLMAIHG
jgi:hypothetical protein